MKIAKKKLSFFSRKPVVWVQSVDNKFFVRRAVWSDDANNIGAFGTGGSLQRGFAVSNSIRLFAKFLSNSTILNFD